ncbi:MAG: P-II family nitrogen regulator [Deltaproteobacteria bacterium]|nr:MAG: P-II family nitrogen regulator [Deltaproteobacteria bacterium]
MKEVMAIIRINKINPTKQALVDAGFPAFTAIKGLGRGRRPVNFEILQAMNENPSDSVEVLSTLSQGGRLIPKRIISLIVPDETVPDVIQTIIKVNKTGNPGDGKIFVMPIDDVVRVRTGETGAKAIDEMTG